MKSEMLWGGTLVDRVPPLTATLEICLIDACDGELICQTAADDPSPKLETCMETGSLVATLLMTTTVIAPSAREAANADTWSGSPTAQEQLAVPKPLLFPS
jgi:hypothetical protein